VGWIVLSDDKVILPAELQPQQDLPPGGRREKQAEGLLPPQGYAPLHAVRKILKEKHEKDRATQREKLSHENKEERLNRRLQHKVKTEFCDPDADTPLHVHYGRSGNSADSRDKTKNKPDLNFIEVKFEN
jgi:hypothetical protein